jgi:pimeloyl-ACP methyl ester carboxylesterase
LLNVFGPLKCPILVFLGGEDTSYTKEVKAKLPEHLGRLRDAAGEDWWSPLSGILEGAGHNIEEEEPIKVLLERVEKFVSGL